MKECLGVKPICPNGNSPVCNTTTGEWVCQGIAMDGQEIENKNVVEQSTSDIDGSEGADRND